MHLCVCACVYLRVTCILQHLQDMATHSDVQFRRASKTFAISVHSEFHLQIPIKYETTQKVSLIDKRGTAMSIRICVFM